MKKQKQVEQTSVQKSDGAEVVKGKKGRKKGAVAAMQPLKVLNQPIKVLVLPCR